MNEEIKDKIIAWWITLSIVSCMIGFGLINVNSMYGYVLLICGCPGCIILLLFAIFDEVELPLDHPRGGY